MKKTAIIEFFRQAAILIGTLSTGFAAFIIFALSFWVVEKGELLNKEIATGYGYLGILVVFALSFISIKLWHMLGESRKQSGF